MSQRYCCGSTDRRADLVEAGFQTWDGHPLNAIDFLEVVDRALAPHPPLRQRVLLVRFFTTEGLDTLERVNVSITGGTTVTEVRVVDALRLDSPLLETRLPAVHAWFTDPDTAIDSPDCCLVVLVDQRGDHSIYELALVDGLGADQPPDGFDTVLSRVRFGFKVECASEFDCEEEVECSVDLPAPPQLDYLARDYQSFRQLMLDRLSVLLPDWQERNPADLGVTLVELLAYSADRVSYFQDAVATEAYLGTARLRTSVRRHARLLDYRVHEGCNARAWVQLVMAEGQQITGGALVQGARFYTHLPAAGPVVSSASELQLLQEAGDAEAFEALHGLDSLSSQHNEIHLHTWGETRCVLPAGSTSAVLRTRDRTGALDLAPGDVLVLEEVRHPETGAAADADPLRRHAVRLTQVGDEDVDPLYGTSTWAVSWHEEDATPFALCLSRLSREDVPVPVTVARGNIVLVDHGLTRSAEALVPAEVPLDGRCRPRLAREDLTWTCTWEPSSSARASLLQDPRQALPALRLDDVDQVWLPVAELLGSDPFAREFVVEMEADGRAWIRFGDGVLGQRPPQGVSLAATYRTGRGPSGNVGAEAIRHLVSDTLAGAVAQVLNPLPAQGGTEPEPLQSVRLQAPVAFKVQMRAVTEEDWAEVAARHPAVQRAVATLRHSGSWHTVFLTVDPVGGRVLDEALRAELRAFLEPFRLAGVDLELRPPAYVPIDLRLVLCVDGDHFAHEVKTAALRVLSSRVNPDGSQGWFHPDRLSFGEDVHLSPIVAQLMGVPGVAWVDLDPESNGSDLVRFQRLDRTPAGELEAGVMPVGRLEVARLDNDPSAPDHGRLRLTMRGGR